MFTVGVVVLLSLALIAGEVAYPPPAVASDTSTRWETFSESSGCSDPYTRTPFVSKKGGLGESEPILGPFGTYFGRSIADVRSRLASWGVPGSGGRVVNVHQDMIPALNQVAANLAAEAGNGRVYAITSVGGFNPRTIGGSYQLSRHGLGLAIDINPPQNPYRADNKLITNMPTWFVDAWRSAGFCWGGDWQSIKDPMHFSWIGPGAAGSPGPALSPGLPNTNIAAFAGPSASHFTPFGPVMSRYSLSVADGNGNGAPDVVGLRSHPDGAVIDIARSTGGYGECSTSRWFVPDSTVAGAHHVVFGDVDGDSRQDLVALTGSNATVATRRGEFEDPTVRATGLGPSAASVTAADFDGDHLADLWEGTPDGRLKVWKGPNWTQLIDDQPLPGGAPLRIVAADRHGGDTPELFALYPSANGSKVEVLTFNDSWTPDGSIAIGDSPELIAAIGAGDYDGDGRADAQVLDGFGTLTAYIGNTPTGVPSARWFLHPEWDCDDDHAPLSFVGTFYDDDASMFQPNIEAIAAAGITLGCNPPFGDKFCSTDAVTREEMAAFLVRALGLEINSHPGFADVGVDNIFVDEIGRLATAGITLGCSESGDVFCPKDMVTREEMAAFLVRALGLEVNSHPGFVDVTADNIFVEDVGRLATAGITLGCSPDGDMFCPKGAVSREEMAAFLDRSLLGGA